MDRIKIAIVGVGNCASSLLQGIEYYRTKPHTRLLVLCIGISVGIVLLISKL